MFDRQNLEALAAFEGSQPMVSLYLGMPPSLRSSSDAFRTRLKGLLKKVSDRANAEDITAIEEYFNREFDWLGRSVVVYSGQADDFWKVEQFAVPIRSRAHVGLKPFIMPLANIMDGYGSYAVAALDQQNIQMYYFHLGEMIATEHRTGEDVKRIKSGGGAKGRSRGDDLGSHHEELVKGNLKQFTDLLAQFCAHYKVEHILLGGVEQTLHQFKGLLGQPWKDRVEGMFTLTAKATESEIRERSLDVMRENLLEKEAKLVETITTLNAKGGNGIMGKAETLEAINASRVQTLVLAENAFPPEEADEIIAKTVDYGGTVVFVDADSPINKSEGIGALLRY